MKDFIRIQGVSKWFGDFVAVDNVSLDIAKGELFSILGGSGCGKTTLLRILAGFEVPSSGTVKIDGVDVTNLAPYDRPVNMMFQSYAIFPHMNVTANISYGLRKEGVAKTEIARRVDEMLELVQLSDFRNRKPDALSGGQRQRISIARAVLVDPPILVLDEATSAVDNETEAAIQRSLEKVSVGRTTVVIAHRLSTIRHADRIYVLSDGEVAETGTHGELVALGGIYRGLWDVQTGEAVHHEG